MNKEATLTERTTLTDNPHLRLAEELRRKRPECIVAFRALVNRKKTEREQRRAA